MNRWLKRARLSRSGASAAEYALMIAFIAGVVVIGATSLGANVKQVFNEFAPKMQTPN
ncbi:Flp family type IVb pilin [Sphingosinicellaceae bacterium]|nr:Flp family type IVb pilin [Sphingosinicellaceae bacterium]